MWTEIKVNFYSCLFIFFANNFLLAFLQVSHQIKNQHETPRLLIHFLNKKKKNSSHILFFQSKDDLNIVFGGRCMQTTYICNVLLKILLFTCHKYCTGSVWVEFLLGSYFWTNLYRILLFHRPLALISFKLWHFPLIKFVIFFRFQKCKDIGMVASWVLTGRGWHTTITIVLYTCTT